LTTDEPARLKIFANFIKSQAGNAVSLMAAARLVVISGWLEGKVSGCFDKKQRAHISAAAAAAT
jgi:hypothetical protein